MENIFNTEKLFFDQNSPNNDFIAITAYSHKTQLVYYECGLNRESCLEFDKRELDILIKELQKASEKMQIQKEFYDLQGKKFYDDDTANNTAICFLDKHDLNDLFSVKLRKYTSADMDSPDYYISFMPKTSINQQNQWKVK